MLLTWQEVVPLGGFGWYKYLVEVVVTDLVSGDYQI